jgi:hypothetical protein
MTPEMIKRGGRGVLTVSLSVIAAFGGGMVGAVYSSGKMYQQVQDIRFDVNSLQSDVRRLDQSDLSQKEKIEAHEVRIDNHDNLLKEIHAEHQAMIRSLGRIEGKLNFMSEK